MKDYPAFMIEDSIVKMSKLTKAISRFNANHIAIFTNRKIQSKIHMKSQGTQNNLK